MTTKKFPKCEEYGLHEQVGAFGLTHICIPAFEVEQALSKAENKGKEVSDARKDIIEKQKERIAQLEAEVMGLEGCCQVLEKAFGVPKKATLKQIDERIRHFVKLEADLTAFEDICKQYKAENKKLKQNKVYSCGNCEKLEKEVALLHDVEVHLQVCENNKKHSVEFGRKAQYTDTINLFNKLRNNRFQFNDEVKMVIDMLKDEMTRQVSK